VKASEYNDPVEVWAKPLGSLSSGVQAVMLVNLSAAPAEAKVEWADLALAGRVAVRDLWLHKDLGEFRDAYTVRLPSHGSALLKVTGEFDWSHGAEFEAEWPGNTRGGDAVLLQCPECSKGYAVSLRGAGKGSAGSSLTFTHINVSAPGRYWANLVYVYSGEANNTVQVSVNQGKATGVKLAGAIYGTAKIPVDLIRGENSIEFKFAAEGTVDIDRLALTR
jgi:hypothetical protein